MENKKIALFAYPIAFAMGILGFTATIISLALLISAVWR